MKQRHVSGARANAQAVFAAAGVKLDTDFHTLRSSQVDVFLEEADRVRYRKPKGANGSRARYFFALMQRQARAEVVS